MSKSATDSPSDTRPVATPGKMFADKRKENDWSKKKVADALLLSVSQVAALENDEYDKLPEPTYIIGYWRSYASLLKIDATQSIEFYKNNLDGTDSDIALDAHHRHAHGQHEKHRKKTALLFCLLSAIFLAAIWYWQNPDDSPLKQWIENQWIEKQTNRQPPEAVSNNASNVNDADNVNDEPSAEQQTPSLTTLDANQQPTIALPEPNFSDQLASDPSAPKNLAGQISDKARALPYKPADEHTQKTGTLAMDSPNWILVKVKKRTWLDVRDVTGAKLIYRTADVGEAIQLHGNPPFDVFVGVADGVLVEYLGEVIESKSDDGIFARIQVGRGG